MSASPHEYGSAKRLAHDILDIKSVPAVLSPVIRLVTNPAPHLPASSDAADASPHHHRGPVRSDTDVGREVRRLRRAQGKTLKVLASAVGVTGAQLHRYETGATRIAASRLIAIADALGVRPDVLIAAGAAQVPARPVAPEASDDDIVDLIRVFSGITDPRHRTALLAVARMMAAHYQRHVGLSDEG